MNATPARCRSCGAPIFFALSTKGRRVPIDYQEVPGGNLCVACDGEGLPRAVVVAGGRGSYVSHFATCPDAAQHRGARARATRGAMAAGR